MSRAKENANPLQNRYYEARSGSGAHWTRARVRVSFPNAHVSRFSLASPVKRENITPVLQAKNHPRRHRGKSEGKGKSKRAEKMPFSTFLRDIFFRPFRLSVALTICSWVAEDGKKWSSTEPQLITRVLCHTRFP